MAVFRTLLHTSELRALFLVGSSVPVIPGVPTILVLQALLSTPANAHTCSSPGCAICEHPALQTLLFDSTISSLLLPATQCLDFLLSQVPGVLGNRTDLAQTLHLAEV